MSSTIHVTGPGIDRRVTLTEGAGEMTVGRDPAADIHLPDPEKAISRKHLAIRLHGGAIEFRVVSSINGVTSSKGEVAPGATGRLGAGEQITLGSYTLVAVAGAAAPAPSADATSMTSMTSATGTRTRGDPLDVFAGLGGARAAVRSDDPFARPEFNPPAPAAAAQAGGDPFEALLGKPKPVAKPPAAPAGPPGAGAKGADPMALLAGNQQVVKQTGAGQINEWLTPGSSTGATGAGLGGGVLPPGFGGPARPAGAAMPPALSADHVHDFNLPLKLPAAPPPPPAPLPPKSAPAADPWAALQSSLGPAPAAAPGARPPADDPFASLEQAFGDDPFSEWTSNFAAAPPAAGSSAFPPMAPSLPVAPSAPIAAPAMVAPPTAAPQPPARAAAGMGDATLVAAMFEGLGLPAPKEFDAASAQQMGAMMRLMVEGFADLLAARKALKRELRAEDRTMMNARGNNPLKLGLTTDQLLQYLFSTTAQGPAYMPAAKALKETVTELRAHEIATIAAARAAVQGAIQDFEPTKLKNKLTKGKSKLPQFLDNARVWEMYQAHYQQQQQHMADWLDKLFDRHFMPAYSKESDRLRQSMEAADLSDPVPRAR